MVLALAIFTLIATSPTISARALPVAPSQKQAPADTTTGAKASEVINTSAGAVVPASAPSRQKAFVYQTKSGRLPYLLYLPKDYDADPNKRWPMLVFLHGSTEAGKNAEIVKRQALPKLLEGNPDFPFVVLSPQAPSAGGWGYSTKALAGLLDEVLTTYHVDADRVSLTGWSMGGYGVWWMAKAMPDRFAALVPVSGGYIYNAKQLCPVSKIPTWVFHGKKDRNVQFFQSDIVVKALKACGGSPVFTVYDDAEHYSAVDRAYKDPALYTWLLEQKRITSVR